MRIWSRFIVFSLAVAMLACGSSGGTTPLETFKIYTKAIKKKDTEAMKVLLSEATLKMHEQEAQAQGVTVDDIVKRETLFGENQTTVEYRDEKIEGDTATLQVKTQYGSWETVPFVREAGVWKIDKQGYADRMIREIEEQNRQSIEDQIQISPATPSF